MEIWDGYNKDGSYANIDLIREEPIPDGLYHLVSEILVRHIDGDYLLMKRSMDKKAFPGYYESTAGGSALKGENELDCARRELFEETGILSSSFEKIGYYVSHNTIYYSFLCITNCDKDSITTQEGETVSYKWVTEKEFIDFVNSDKMISTQKTRYKNYLTKIGYLK